MAEALLRADPARAGAGDQPRAAARPRRVRLPACRRSRCRPEDADGSRGPAGGGRGPAVRGAGAGGGPALRPGRAATRADRRRGLPAPRRHPARDRAGRGPHRHARHRRDRGAAGRSLPAAHRRPPHRAAAPPDAARHPRLELRAAAPDRAHRPAPPGRLRGRLHAGGGERGRDRPRPRRARGRGQRREPGREVARGRGGRPARARAIACSRRRGPTRSRSSSESGELDQVARRHAEYYRDLFERAETEWETRPTASGWPSTAARSTTCGPRSTGPSPRAATRRIGVALTAAAVPLWFQQSLMVECRGRAERALASLGPRPGRDARREMQLCAALGVSLMQTKGPAPDTIAAWTTALEIAERLADTEYQLRALWGLWHFRVSRGECRAALDAGGALLALGGPRRQSGRSAGRRADGRRLAPLPGGPGECAAASRAACSTTTSPRPGDPHHPLPVRPAAGGAHDPGADPLAAGVPRPGPALGPAPTSRTREAVDHALSLCGALEVACLVAIWSGELADAERSVAMLLDHSARHALSVWHTRGQLPERRRADQARRGRPPDSRCCAPPSTSSARPTSSRTTPACSARWPRASSGSGRSPRGSRRSTRRSPGPSATRSTGASRSSCASRPSSLLLAGGPGAGRRGRGAVPAGARLDAASKGSCRWSCAAPPASPSCGTSRAGPAPARELLAPVYARFTEGFDTAELRAARALLDRLGREP